MNRYVSWCERRRWSIVAVAASLFVVGGWLASRLELRTAFSELLPSDDPGVRYAGLVLGAPLVGVTWMVGAAGWAGVKVTFLNFIALPIALGIGVEYAINVMSRYRERHDVLDAVSGTGGAVALCSLVVLDRRRAARGRSS